MLLVLVGVWDRYAQENPSSNFRPGADAQRTRQGAAHVLQDVAKLVGTTAPGTSNQGMSVALSADGSTAIVGAPGANNADRDRPASAGPAGAAWVFTRSGAPW